MAAIKVLKSKCVIVAISPGSKGSNGISPVAATGLSNALTGSTYPKLVITSPDQTVRYAHLSNKQLYSKADLKKAKETSTTMIKKDSSRLPKSDEAMQFYLLSQPGHYQTLYVGEPLGETSFMGSTSKGGKMKTMSTARFSDGAKKYIKHLYSIKNREKMANRNAKISELMPNLKVETWTSNKGKKLRGKFVSLENGEITLEVPRKSKPITFSIDLLDATSQKRAEKLLAEVNEAKEKIDDL